MKESELGSSGFYNKPQRLSATELQTWSPGVWRPKALVAQILPRAVFLVADSRLLPVYTEAAGGSTFCGPYSVSALH